MSSLSISARATRAAAVVVAIVLLNLSLTFANVWPTPSIRWTGDLSAEVALLILTMSLTSVAGRWQWSRRGVRALAALWVVLIIGRYADVTVQSLFGREINLYWDSRHFSAVGAMLAFVARPWLVMAIIAATIVIPVALFLPCRWALEQVAVATRSPIPRRWLAALAIGTLVIAGIQQRADVPRLPRLASPVTPVFARQARLLTTELLGRERTLPPAPAIDSDLSRVQGADVFVIFLESYGATSWDRPTYAASLEPALERFDAAIRESGRRVASAYVESPTFGGSSWLAHVSLLSGTDVRDGDTNLRMMAEPGRDTLVTAFKRRGYEAVAVMPGLQQVWPEGKFYGFDRIYGVAELDYHGPPFGWWDVTDQYALAKMDALAVAPENRAPLFVFFPTISTHTPFLPVPPYQPDWSRMLDARPYDPAVLATAWDEQPDWLDLGPGYTKALTYSFDAIGGYLRFRGDRDFVVVLVGDHQPPAIVSGEGASWEVPVHVIASRPALLEQLTEQGFRAGLTPRHPAITSMDGLMPVLLDAFGDRDTDSLNGAPESLPLLRSRQRTTRAVRPAPPESVQAITPTGVDGEG